MRSGGDIAANLLAIINRIDDAMDRRALLSYANKLEVEIDRLNVIVDALTNIIKTRLNQTEKK